MAALEQKIRLERQFCENSRREVENLFGGGFPGPPTSGGIVGSPPSALGPVQSANTGVPGASGVLAAPRRPSWALRAPAVAAAAAEAWGGVELRLVGGMERASIQAVCDAR